MPEGCELEEMLESAREIHRNAAMWHRTGSNPHWLENNRVTVNCPNLLLITAEMGWWGMTRGEDPFMEQP